jgi:hypothetical protein
MPSSESAHRNICAVYAYSCRFDCDVPCNDWVYSKKIGLEELACGYTLAYAAETSSLFVVINLWINRPSRPRALTPYGQDDPSVPRPPPSSSSTAG